MIPIFKWAAAFSLFITPAMANAAQEISVPANASWQHAATGLIFSSTVLDAPRKSIIDNSKSELDVMVNYEGADGTVLTFYIYRPALMSVPLWYDRAEFQILNRPEFGGVTALNSATAFAPPKSESTSGLRRTFTPNQGTYKSTAVALMPLNDWLVKIRISSETLDAPALDEIMEQTIASLRWPDDVKPAPAAALVLPCKNTLVYNKSAKLLKPDLGQSLLGSVLATMRDDIKGTKKDSEKDHETVMPWCREGEPTLTYGAYRYDEDKDRYTLAVGDAGRTVGVYPALSLDGGNSQYQLSLEDLDRTYIFPNFNKLPVPERAFNVVTTTKPTSAVSRKGKSIIVGP